MSIYVKKKEKNNLTAKFLDKISQCDWTTNQKYDSFQEMYLDKEQIDPLTIFLVLDFLLAENRDTKKFLTYWEFAKKDLKKLLLDLCEILLR